MSNNTKRAISIVTVFALISKCMGFARDMVLSFYYGADGTTDAYFVSQTIPEFLFLLITQAISISFIPIYLEVRHQQSEDAANAFTDRALQLCWICCFILVTTVYLFPNQLVSLMAMGFDGETFSLAVQFVKITVWGMFFRITASIQQNYLNANKRFNMPAFVGIPYDAIIIASIPLAYCFGVDLLAWGPVIGSLIQFILTLIIVRRIKPRFHFRKKILDSNLMTMIKYFIPVSLGVGVYQINVLVDRTLASKTVGGITALNYATKVDNVLEQIIIASLATVMFASFASFAAQRKTKEFNNAVSKTLLIVSACMIPVTVYAIIYAEPIITLLFGRGAFDAQSINMTSEAMMFYSIGLIALSLNTIINRALYAIKQIALTTAISCAGVGSNVVLNLILENYMGINGLALATSIANILTCLMLLIALKKKSPDLSYRSSFLSFVKCLLSSIAMGGISLLTYFQLCQCTSSIPAFIIAAVVGLILYLLFGYILKPAGLTYLFDSAQSLFNKVRGKGK